MTGTEIVEAAAKRAVDQCTHVEHLSVPVGACVACVQREFAPVTELIEGMRTIRTYPYGCRFYNSGVLRNPSKEHDDDCGYRIAFAALAEAERMGGR